MPCVRAYIYDGHITGDWKGSNADVSSEYPSPEDLLTTAQHLLMAIRETNEQKIQDIHDWLELYGLEVGYESSNMIRMFY